MKKRNKVAFSSIFVLGLVYGGGVAYASTNILPNTQLSAQNVSSFDGNVISEMVANKSITLHFRDARENLSINMSDLSYDISNLETLRDDVIQAQDPMAWPLALINGQDINAINVAIDTDSLNKALKANDVFNTNDLITSQDAKFVVNEDHSISITPEVVGEVLNQDLVKELIVSNLSQGNFDIDLSNAVIKPNLTQAALNNALDSVNTKVTNSIRLAVENTDVVLQPSKDQLLDFIKVDTDNNQIDIDKEAILSYIRDFNRGLVRNATNKDHVYRVAGAGVISRISEGQAVVGLDEFSSTALIYDSLKNDIALDNTVSGVNLTTPRVTYEGKHTVDGNLIEVNIPNQTVYFYKQGVLVLSAPVVTGRPGWDTRPGVFQVDWMARNFTLRGASVGNNLTYEIPVDFWIPFDEHIGLHDLSTRSPGEFGGNTFRTAGSHGCVNMRRADVAFIFENVQPGTGVWVH